MTAPIDPPGSAGLVRRTDWQGWQAPSHVVRALPPKKLNEHREPRERLPVTSGGRHPTPITAMFKPRLRIPRRTGLPRLSLSSAATTSPISPFAAAAARSIHAGPEKGTFQVPPLNHIAVLSSEGLKGLYSREGFETAFSLYQQWCCDELNRLTAGMCTACSIAASIDVFLVYLGIAVH